MTAFAFACGRAAQRAPWRFAKGGRAFEQKVDGALVGDDARFALAAAVDGLGVAFLAESFVDPNVRAGRLQVLLRPWLAPRSGYVAFYPPEERPTAAARAFVGFLERAGTPAGADASRDSLAPLQTVRI